MKHSARLWVLVAGCVLLAPWVVYADLPDLDLVDIKQIVWMQLEFDRGEYFARVMVTFTNENIQKVGIRDIKYEVSFTSGEEPLLVGNNFTLPSEAMEIDGAMGEGQPGTVDKELRVRIGPKGDSAELSNAEQRMVNLFNMIGDPQNNPIKMMLKAKGDFGYEMERGWAYGRDVEINYMFVPKIQREVLFE